MFAFYDFPVERWDRLRTTNAIESVFATVRHRRARTKGLLSSTTAKLMRRPYGQNQLPKVIGGVGFKNGVEVTEAPSKHAA